MASTEDRADDGLASGLLESAPDANPSPRPMGAGMELTGRRRDGIELPAEISLSGLLVTWTAQLASAPSTPTPGRS